MITGGRSGSDDVEDLQLLLLGEACNRAKETGTRAELMTKLKERRQSGRAANQRPSRRPGHASMEYLPTRSVGLNVVR